MLGRSFVSVLRSGAGSFSYSGTGRSFDQKVQKRTGMFDSIADLVEKSGGMDKVKQIMSKEFDGASEDGSVTITFTGDDNVTRVKVDPALKERDIAVLEKNIKEAVTKGLKAKQSAMIGEMMGGGGFAGGMPKLPK